MNNEYKYSGAEWLTSYFKKNEKTLSPLALKAADILGQVFRGIYHLSDISIQHWFEPHGVYIFLRNGKELATYDGAELSELVGLCHLHAIRLSISCGYAIWQAENADTTDFEDWHVDRYMQQVFEDDLPENEQAKSCLMLGFYQRNHDGDACHNRHMTLEEFVEHSQKLNAPLEKL